MKAKWEVVLTLGGLFALLLWAKPRLDARSPAPSGDVFIETIRTAQTQTISGPSLIVAVVIVAAFAWWIVQRERNHFVAVGLGALAMWLLFMLGGG